jgi:hypothetical protein
MRFFLKLWIGVGVLVGAASAASGQPLEATVSFVSDPGDYIGDGQTRSFTLDTASIMTQSGQDGGSFRVSVFPFAGGWWYFNLYAPVGTQLVPGPYEGATRFNQIGTPGLDVFGDGRGCNAVTGRFDVFEAVFGPNGYIERFHAQFEQHCEGGEPALRGEIFVVNPPPPPPLEITLSVHGTGKVNKLTGVATVTGTLKCTLAVTVNLSANLSQRLTRFAQASGSGWASLPCSPDGAAWSLSVPPQGTVPFGAGMAQGVLAANGYDNYYGNLVTVGATPAIKLMPK